MRSSLLFLLLLSFSLLGGCQAISTFTLVLGGDVTLSRNPGKLFRAEGAEALWSGLRPAMIADVRLANLEGALSTDLNQPWAGPKDEGLVLVAPPSAVAILAASGLTAVSVANNHILDSGVSGLKQTLGLLEANGIGHAGAGEGGAELRPWVYHVEGEKAERTLVLLAFAQPFPELRRDLEQPPVAIAKPDLVLASIHQARLDYPLAKIVVSMHWGVEGAPDPSQAQRDLGRACIDAGADVVWGHHPHVLQPIERRSDGVILYSLGNLLFDSPGDEGRHSAMARLIWGPSGPPKVELIPLRLEGPARVPRVQ